MTLLTPAESGEVLTSLPVRNAGDTRFLVDA